MQHQTDQLDIDGINAQRAFEQNPEAQFVRKEQIGLLVAMAKDYPSDVFYDYLHLLFVQGYSYAEIADLKGISKTLAIYRVESSIMFLRRKIKQKNLRRI